MRYCEILSHTISYYLILSHTISYYLTNTDYFACANTGLHFLHHPGLKIRYEVSNAGEITLGGVVPHDNEDTHYIKVADYGEIMVR